MLSCPSSQRMRKRGNGLRTSTSSTTPKRGGRSVDSDSATTRSPVLRSMSYLHARFKPERTPAASIAPDLDRARRPLARAPGDQREQLRELILRALDTALVAAHAVEVS